MKTFTIDNENNITVFASAADVPAAEGIATFSSEKALAKVAKPWPASRLVDIWNSLTGVTPVKKFADRQKAAARIWIALQTLGDFEAIEATQNTDAENAASPKGAQARDVAAAKPSAATKATREGKAPKAAKVAGKPRETSKTAAVLELMRREGGVTANELMTATGWQAHSVRGFISGTLGKKMGLIIVSTKPENGERTYSIQA